ncbi:hypothetical protein JXA80_01965 [bacterium]|nr:hypothetical protein [candidate division CSSED10-310 bacterium]
MRLSGVIMMIFIILCSGGLAVAASGWLRADAEPLSVNYMRTIMQDWTIEVTPQTVFVPTDPVLPNPFVFNDLTLDMPVLVHGHQIPGLSHLIAETVFVFSSPGQAAQLRTNPPQSPGSVFGLVSLIDPAISVFHVWEDGYAGQILDVLVMPGSEFWDAPVGFPRQPLAGIHELNPGDPIMIHGYRYNDTYRGTVFVRSSDWFPEDPGRDGLDIMEVYGWVDRVFLSPYGDPVVAVWVDTLTGDPNHQTFTTWIGPDGGYVSFPWGHLFFPIGAINQATEITVTGDFMFWWTIQNIYEFSPDIEFQVPVDIEIRYFNLDGIDPDRVKLVYFDEELEKWRLACHMTHFPAEHCFRGQVDHFSRYSLSTNNRPLQGMPIQPN